MADVILFPGPCSDPQGHYVVNLDGGPPMCARCGMASAAGDQAATPGQAVLEAWEAGDGGAAVAKLAGIVDGLSNTLAKTIADVNQLQRELERLRHHTHKNPASGDTSFPVYTDPTPGD